MINFTDEMRDLYQETILDHNRSPRNFRKIEGAESLEGFNPLCGDRMTIYIKMDGELIADIGFEGSGCAISKSSASIMTTIIKGLDKKSALEWFEKFHKLITRPLGAKIDSERFGKLLVFAQVSEYPSRVKCAGLAWHTLKSILDGKKESVSTE